MLTDANRAEVSHNTTYRDVGLRTCDIRRDNIICLANLAKFAKPLGGPKR